MKYLWDDAFKFNHPDVFVTSKDGKDVNSLEVLIECFSSARGNKRFDVFEDTIKEALLETRPAISDASDVANNGGEDVISDDGETASEVIDGGTVTTSSDEQVVDVDGGNAAGINGSSN